MTFIARTALASGVLVVSVKIVVI